MTDLERIAAARRAIGLIDLTDLADDHSPVGIDELCRRAREHATAAVCVWPEFVATCAAQLRGTGVRVATVVNFPSGDEPIDAVTVAVVGALADGADDIDVVLPYRAVLAGDPDQAAAMVAAVAELIESPVLLKVILETGALDDRAVDLVGGAAGDRQRGGLRQDLDRKDPGRCHPRRRGGDARRHCRRRSSGGLKPSGGIRTFDDAMAYIDLADSVMGEGWAKPATFRFGASGLLDSLLAVIDGDSNVQSSSSY